MDHELPQLTGRPARVFISVDGSTGRSTLSFAPPEVAPPILREDDARGEAALAAARAIAAAYPGCVVEGPYFHESALRRTRTRPRR